MITASKIKAKISLAMNNVDIVLQNNAGMILMLSAQVCSTIMATLGRVLRTDGSSGSNAKSTGTSEV
jgi:hypothetical protein